MPDQPSGAQANADVTEAGLRLGEEYDQNRDKRAEEQANENKELGEARELRAGAVVTGTAPQQATETTFPGASLRGLADDTVSGGAAARAAKGLATDGVTAADTSWTAQSARPFVDDNAADVPGQTFRAEELPDPLVVNASNLPGHVIPAGLVVDVDVPTDNLNTSQEGGDASTGPREAQAPAPQAAQSKAEGRTVRGSKADKADADLNR